MIEREDLCAALEAELVESRARYEVAQDDACLSYVYAAETKTLIHVCQSLEDGMSVAELAAKAREKIPELEQAMREEDEHPTFDWDNEHYHYLCYEGQRDAWRAVQRILLLAPGRQHRKFE